jgi:hypothetical protein
MHLRGTPLIGHLLSTEQTGKLLEQVGTYSTHRPQNSLRPAVAPYTQRKEASKVNAVLKLVTDPSPASPQPTDSTSLKSKNYNRLQLGCTILPNLADSNIRESRAKLLQFFVIF